MKIKLTLLLIGICLLAEAQYTPKVRRIGLHNGYHSYDNDYFTFDQPEYKAYTGDTIEWYVKYGFNSSTIPGSNWHTITSNVLPPGAEPFDYDINADNRDTTIRYVTKVKGGYAFYCIPHTYTTSSGLVIAMAGSFTILDPPTVSCSGIAMNGTTCLGTSLCTSCVGVYQNCVCSPIDTNLCANGITNGSTCLGVGACTNCVGTVVGCNCTILGVINDLFGIDERLSLPILQPNPATETVTVPLRASTKYNIYVYNLLGSEVLTKRVENQAFTEMDIRSLPAGTYVVQTKYCACSTPKELCQGANKQYRFIKE